MHPVDKRYWQIIVAAWVLFFAIGFYQIVSTEREFLANPSMLVMLAILWTFTAALVVAILVAMPLRIAINLVMPSRRRARLEETITMATLLLLIAGYLWESRREKLALMPPPGVETITDFAARMPAPRRLELVQQGGRDYLVWFGETSGPIDIPSGPSCYLFDADGKLLDWQLETGDGGRVEKFLQSSTKVRELTVEEAVRLKQTITASRNSVGSSLL